MSSDRLFRSRLLQAAAIPFSWAYGCALALRSTPDVQRVKARVISIGNLHVGGTGKTPHVIAVVSALRNRALNERAQEQHRARVAVVSRGYGARLSRAGARVEATHTASDVGDEPLEIFAALNSTATLNTAAAGAGDVPVFIGADRVRAATEASKVADIIVLDDGFQHRRLARDLDVVLIPLSANPEKQHLLPWGRLREPLEALRRADVVVLVREIGGDDFESAWRQRLNGPVFVSERLLDGVRPYPGTVEPVALLGRNVIALSGVADPPRFHRAIEAAGGRIVEILAHVDHHVFTDDDLKLAEKLSHRHDGLVVMTAKDVARLSGRRLPFPAAILSTTMRCPEFLDYVTQVCVTQATGRSDADRAP